MKACENDNIEIVTLLLDKGADINSCNSKRDSILNNMLNLIDTTFTCLQSK